MSVWKICSDVFGELIHVSLLDTGIHLDGAGDWSCFRHDDCRNPFRFSIVVPRQQSLLIYKLSSQSVSPVGVEQCLLRLRV